MPWPKHVIFLEQPIICRWDHDNKYWTSANISKVEYDNENNIITFRTGVFGIFAFATLRYNHLPFRNWRIIPEKDESVTVKLITAGLRIDFNIKGGLICLALLEKYTTSSLNHIIGKYFKLSRLKRHIKAAGVDIFPGKYDKLGEFSQYIIKLLLQLQLIHKYINHLFGDWNTANLI